MGLFAYALTPQGHFLERVGLDFEDFTVGQYFMHRPGVTVSQQDNVMESLDTLNAAMLHYDNHYAAKTSWQRPLMVSTVTLQALIGELRQTIKANRDCRDTVAEIVAARGWAVERWHAARGEAEQEPEHMRATHHRQ